MYWTNLNGKTIGIWGMGREGIAARTAVQTHCKDITLKEITEDNTDEIFSCDVLIKSPGVSLYRSEIQQALQWGIVVTSGTNLYFNNKAVVTRVIAVTGTKGKSTTASLLTHTLSALGQRTVLGGNIGKPLLDFVDEEPAFAVAELSSYQCADLTGHPDIGVLVNLYPEHLQWHGTHERYYQDKWHMICQCRRVVLNETDSRIQKMAVGADALWFNGQSGIHIREGMFYDGATPIFAVNRLNLVGEHNAENACAVLTVIKLLGLNPEQCERAFASFQALPHRLQTIGIKKGITYVDDSISTTPETAIAALKALYHGQPITLIAGGMDRGQDYTTLIHYMAQHREQMRLVTLPDTGERIIRMAQQHHIEASPTSDMPTAVSIAQHITPTGGMILLSPAAPSYNLYPNFEARGADFKKWIRLDEK